MTKICPLMSRPLTIGVNGSEFLVPCRGSQCAAWAPIHGKHGYCGMTPNPMKIETFPDPARTGESL